MVSLAGTAGLMLHASAAIGARVVSVGQLNSELGGGYHVAAGDNLRVTVFDEPTLTGEYLIGVGGELSLPLIDAIAADGKSTRELARIISEKLKAGGYVLAPRVAVEITKHRPFYILGEVKKPGEYPYSGDLTFEQAVASAGGFTPRANHRMITIRREGLSEQLRVRLESDALKIAPGDTITVRESFF
jgi:polysaccharide export outer membrane protein